MTARRTRRTPPARDPRTATLDEGHPDRAERGRPHGIIHRQEHPVDPSGAISAMLCAGVKGYAEGPEPA